MARTYRIQGDPTLPSKTPNGWLLSFNPATGLGGWIPDEDWVEDEYTYQFTVELLCDGIVTDTSDAFFRAPENQSEQIIIKVIKNDCVTGTPTAVEYTIPAGLVTGPQTVEHLNWLAYVQAQADAQAFANEEGSCIFDCASSEPCVTIAEMGHMVINGTPGYTIKIYKRGLVLFEMVLNEMGVLDITHPGLIGEIYVTQTDLDGLESNPQCMPFILTDTTKKCCKKKQCSCGD